MPTAIEDARHALIGAKSDLNRASKAWDRLADDASQAEVNDAQAELDRTIDAAEQAERKLHTLVEAGAAGDLDVRVNEPDLYEARSEHRFLEDLFAAKVQSDPVASERISRHQKFEMEKRSVTSGTMGGIIPPQYLVDLTAKASRYGRVFADQCNRMDLPPVGMTLTVPRVTTPSAAGIQSSENSTVTTQDIAETDLSIPVRTVAGYLPVSRQALERSAGYSEEILFEDLIARVWSALDVQCLTGSGSSGQVLGLFNTSSVVAVSANSDGTIVGLWNTLTNAISQINTKWGGLGIKPSKIIVHPRRWGAVTSYLDNNNRPLFGFNNVPAMQYFNGVATGESSYGFVGNLQGLPVFVDSNVPTNLDTNTNRDAVIVLSDPPGAPILWEPPEGLTTLTFEEQAGNALTVQLVAYETFAFSAGRYPDASAIIDDFPAPVYTP
jgi:HK97 family phage major capsid protein